MLYCAKCGSELKGAKKYCNVCGARQSPGSKRVTGPPPELRKKEKQQEEVELGECFRCGQEADRKCFFCEGFICKDHVRRMQANVASRVDMEHYMKYNDKIRINQGWRGYIINACIRCSSIKHMKDLNEDENEKIRTVDVCTWYPVD